MSVPAVEFKNIRKQFGAVQANDAVSFSVARGSIHGIIGENGAGKSTAMKILFGFYEADSGEILVHGKAAQLTSPTEAMAAGIGMVHQHFMLAEPVTALDNILLQQPGSLFSKLPRAAEKARLEKLAHQYGFDLNLEATVESLSVGAQQRLELLKILSQNSDIIILDEPTAVLTPQEVQDLFVNLRALRDQGKTILLITHKLKEVMALTDEVTVFRAGRVIGSKKTASTNSSELAEMMVGRRIATPQERSTHIGDKEILCFNKVSASLGEQHIENIDFKVHAGEIVGIAGVEGNGQNVLIRALLEPSAISKKSFKGDIQINGQSLAKKSAQAIRALGVGAFPEDRLRFGVLISKNLVENFLLGRQRLKKFLKGGFLNHKLLMEETNQALKNYDIRPPDASLTLGQLSGGNQQKLVVARELADKPSLIVAAQPTRGVDIGAIEFIHGQLRKARDNQAAVLLISSELDELLTLSDRLLVMYKGQVVKEFRRQDFNETQIGAAMGGCP
jgi:simple sugar transport system ATP-binding protein